MPHPTSSGMRHPHAAICAGENRAFSATPSSAAKITAHLLARRLPAHVKTLVPRRGDLGKVHRCAAQFHARPRIPAPAARPPPAAARAMPMRCITRHARDRNACQRTSDASVSISPAAVPGGRCKRPAPARPAAASGIPRRTLRATASAKQNRCSSGRTSARSPRHSSRRP